MHSFIALDVETTGTDFCSSQVIQCGVVFLDRDLRETGKREWNVNYRPEKFSWDPESAAVHGIDEDVAREHGAEPEVFLKEFEQDIVKHYGTAGTDLHVIAANAYFDYLMLDRLWNIYRSDFPLPLSRRLMDLSSLSLAVLGTAGIVTVSERLGIPTDTDKAHSALYDAELHLKLFRSLISVARQEGLAIS